MNYKESEYLVQIVKDFQFIQDHIGEWQTKTFPNSTQNSLIKHLTEEINNELKVDCNVDELADIGLLLTGLAHKRGVNLIEEMFNKFEINKTREWQLPDEDGVSRDIK